MELWMTLGLLAYLSGAVSTTMDKHFMNRGYNPVGVSLFKLFFDGVILLVVGLLFFSMAFTPKLLWWSLVVGFLYGTAMTVYFAVLRVDDLKTVMPYLQSAIILFTFLGAITFLGEHATAINYLGLLLILAGVYMVMAKRGFARPKLSKKFWLFAIAAALHTLLFLLVKKALYDVEPITLSTMMYFAGTVVMLAYSTYVVVKRKEKGIFVLKNSWMSIPAIFGALATLLMFTAVSIGNASKVYPMQGIQSAFIFILAWFFLKEKFYWLRMAGTALVVVGIYLLAI